MNPTRPLLLFIVAVAGIFLINFTACVQGKQGRAPSRTGKMAGPSGLQPAFPDKARCIEISSPYGSPTRYDGSRRPEYRFGGRHGGIDLSLTGGTPLLAVAGGTVVSKGEGERMEGIYIWLRHPPADTGLPYWVYSKYQHLQSLPELPVGTKVVVGQVIALSGKTGTTGGHYGTNGYPHLHLAMLKNPSGEYQGTGPPIRVPGSYLIDPLTFYQVAGSTSKEPIDSPSREKIISIPYMTTDGQFQPQGTRVVWPVACHPK